MDLSVAKFLTGTTHLRKADVNEDGNHMTVAWRVIFAFNFILRTELTIVINQSHGNVAIPPEKFSSVFIDAMKNY
jgi:hypothetical protein